MTRLSIDVLEPRLVLNGGSFVGTLFNDADSNRYQSAGEEPLVGWRVYVDSNLNRRLDAGESFGTTDSNGNYVIDNLALNVSHRLRVHPTSGYEPTTSSFGTFTLSSTTPSTRNFAQRLSNGLDEGRVIGFVHFDTDQDGQLPPVLDVDLAVDPPAAPNRTVYVDVNNNRAFDAGEPSGVSAADGRFVIEGAPHGNYFARLLSRPGWTTTSDPYASVSIGVEDARADFAVYSSSLVPSYPSETEEVTGFVWHDVDGNGAEFGESRLAGWRVFADLNVNGIRDATEPTDITDTQGTYALDVPIGNRAIVVELQSGWAATRNRGGAADVVRVTDDAFSLRSFIGVNRTTTVQGTVFNDLNGNGLQDAGEPGLGGWRVYEDTHLGDGDVFLSYHPQAITAADGSFQLQTHSSSGNQVIKTEPANPSDFHSLFSHTTGSFEVVPAPANGVVTANFGQRLGLRSNETTWQLDNRQYGFLCVDRFSDNAEVGGCFHDETYWSAVDTPSGVLLKHQETGEYLTGQGYEAFVQSSITPESYWTILLQDDGSFAFQNNVNGKYLDADGASGDFDADLSDAIGFDDGWFLRLSVEDDPVRFGAIGDYGVAGNTAEQIADAVGHANVNFMLGLGDARYDGSTFDDVHGLYCDLLAGVQPGPNCPTGGDALYNRFFAAVGNHDITDGGGIGEYLDYFNLPGALGADDPSGSERYYDFVHGNVHVFVLDSTAIKTDATQAAAQRQWLEDQATSSPADWQVVVSHHSPYSSGGIHGSDPDLQLPFRDWGVDLVLSGDNHVYERLEVNGVTYIVNGVGGRSLHPFGRFAPGTQVRFNESFGVSIFESTKDELTGFFLTEDGTTEDQFSVQQNRVARSIHADAGPDQLVGVGDLVTLDGTFSSGSDEYQWLFDSVPAGSSASIIDADHSVSSFVPDVQGTYVLRLEVSNPRLEDFDTVTIHVGPATQPEEVWQLRNRFYANRRLTEAADHNAELLLPSQGPNRWIVSNSGAGITLQNRATGRYLAAENYEAFTVTTITNNARWQVVNNSDGSIALRNFATGRYLDGDGANDDWNVDESIAIGADDGWIIETEPMVTEVWTLNNRQYSSRQLAESAQMNAYLAPQGGQNTRWVAEQTSDGIYLRNESTGNYLVSSNYDGFTVTSRVQGALWNVIQNSDGSIALQNSVTGRYLDGDGASSGWDVDESIQILLDDGWFVGVASLANGNTPVLPPATPTDVVRIINELTLREKSDRASAELSVFDVDALKLDRNDDGLVTPQDAVILINRLQESVVPQPMVAGIERLEGEDRLEVEESLEILDAVLALEF